jgi:hypothetical protein
MKFSISQLPAAITALAILFGTIAIAPRKSLEKDGKSPAIMAACCLWENAALSPFWAPLVFAAFIAGRRKFNWWSVAMLGVIQGIALGCQIAVFAYASALGRWMQTL